MRLKTNFILQPRTARVENALLPCRGFSRGLTHFVAYFASYTEDQSSKVSRKPSSNKNIKLSWLLKQSLRDPEWAIRQQIDAWLEKKGYKYDEFIQWRRLLLTRHAAKAITMINDKTPFFLTLETFRKFTDTRNTYLRLVTLYRRLSAVMDDVTRFYAISLLISRATKFDSSLLKVLHSDIEAMPQSLKRYHFNHLLEALAEHGTPDESTYATQMVIMTEMQYRGLDLTSTGYLALLRTHEPDESSFKAIQAQMMSAGYAPPASYLTRHNETATRDHKIDHASSTRFRDLLAHSRFNRGKAHDRKAHLSRGKNDSKHVSQDQFISNDDVIDTQAQTAGIEDEEVSDLLRSERLATLRTELYKCRTLHECMQKVVDLGMEMTDPQIWPYVIGHYHNPMEALSVCLELIRRQKISLTPKLTCKLFEFCRKLSLRRFVPDVVSLAQEMRTQLDAATWSQYLRCLLGMKRFEFVVGMLNNEPGYVYPLVMDSAMQKDPVLWFTVVSVLNSHVRRNKMTGARHAALMSKILPALKRHAVESDYNLLRGLLEAGLCSGSRNWNGMHTCDAVVDIFKHEIDPIDKPWKVKCAGGVLWRAYMLVLVANEETTLLVDAMQRLIASGQRPRPGSGVAQVFALGLLESGDLSLVGHWAKYFEEELGIPWPSDEEAFQIRQHPDLVCFYGSDSSMRG